MKPLRIRLVPREKRLLDLRLLEKALARLLPCLEVCERVVGKGRLRVRYVIKQMNIGSLGVAAEPMAIKGNSEMAEAAVALFRNTIGDLEAGRSPSADFASDDLKTFWQLAHFTAKNLKQFQFDDVIMTSESQAFLDRLLSHEIVSYGSVRGRLEAINIHEQRVFRIYPAGTSSSIECLFPEEMMPLVQRGLGQMVTVKGRLSYRATALLPFRVKVLDMEVHSPETAPRLSECCGILRDHILPEYQDKPAEQIIREIRDAESETACVLGHRSNASLAKKRRK